MKQIKNKNIHCQEELLKWRKTYRVLDSSALPSKRKAPFRGVAYRAAPWGRNGAWSCYARPPSMVWIYCRKKRLCN